MFSALWYFSVLCGFSSGLTWGWTAGGTVGFCGASTSGCVWGVEGTSTSDSCSSGAFGRIIGFLLFPFTPKTFSNSCHISVFGIADELSLSETSGFLLLLVEKDSFEFGDNLSNEEEIWMQI